MVERAGSKNGEHMSSFLKIVLRILLAPLFWPMGLLALGLTASVEFLQDEPDWECWRESHGTIFNMMGVQKLFQTRQRPSPSPQS